MNNITSTINQKLRMRDFYHPPLGFLALLLGFQLHYFLPNIFPNLFKQEQSYMNLLVIVIISFVVLKILKSIPYSDLVEGIITALALGMSFSMFAKIDGRSIYYVDAIPALLTLLLFLIYMVDYKRISHVIRPVLLAFTFSIATSSYLVKEWGELLSIADFWNVFSAIIFYFSFFYLLKFSEYKGFTEGSKVKLNGFIAGILAVLIFAFYFANHDKNTYTYIESMKEFKLWDSVEWFTTFSLLIVLSYLFSLLMKMKEVVSPVREKKRQTAEQGSSKINSPSHKNKDKKSGNPMEELQEMIGLPGVKAEVENLVKEITAAKMREKAGLKAQAKSRHLVFTGSPGTGKTTVARLVARIYADLGILSKGHFVETDRASFVGTYIGQTEAKTEKIIQSALGGVLFIDEAYALADGGENDFGKQAIDVLLKRMEDFKDDLIVIVAGYTDNMNDFISSNPGLESRFPTYIEFEDYAPDEMVSIFELLCKQGQYSVTQEALNKLRTYFNLKYLKRDKQFGNGRFVRNTYEKITGTQSNRIVTLHKPSKQELMTITGEDIENSKLQ